MQLKLKIGDDMLTIDVKETDTFQDISDRLCNLGNIQVDMNQLSSSDSDKPFNMLTNVVEYFTKTTKDTDYDTTTQSQDVPVDAGTPCGLCRLCGEMIVTSPHFLFEAAQESEMTLGDKINSSLPIHVSKKDAYPKQVCEKCMNQIEDSYDFVRTVLEAQNILETRVRPDETFRHKHKNDRCPLCNNGFLMQVNMKQEAKGSMKSSTEKGVTVQVPKSTPKTTLKRPKMEEENLNTEFYQSDEVVTGYWEPKKSFASSSDDNTAFQIGHSSFGGRKYKKKIKTEDDQDWTIDEEYIPVSRRGRPKGTKNKPKVISTIQRSCVLCDWSGADLDMLAHTINVHCQPDLGYFPCPMCKTRYANEIDLESHIEEHTMAARKMKSS